MSLAMMYRRLNIYKSRFLKYDIVAGIVVFLVAIPLCLGIALASGVPLFSGLLSGIIGGIIVGALSASSVSVSGPAAGMVAVVVMAITQLGSFNTFLFALCLAGIIQIFLGTFRAGFIAEYIPSNVIQGLLCAIGVLLIIKQLPLAFTLSADFTELKRHLLETTEGLTLNPLYELPQHINGGAAVISLISFFLLFYLDKHELKWLKGMPSPILVVVIGVVINELFMLSGSSLAQVTPYLVNIPNHDGFKDLIQQLQFPDWTAWKNPNVYWFGAFIAIVASLETLVNIKAAEKLDKKRRFASKNREMVAQGVGNVVAGLIGGIPLTSVIVRTSINVQAGAKTKASAIFHGFFILFSILLIAPWLNKIPLSSLAAILIFTGYKLTKPAIYRSVYAQGWDRFIPFIATVVSIIVFNLLWGVLIGLAIGLFFILRTNSKTRFNILKEIYPKGEITRLMLPQQVTFLNKASLIAALDAVPPSSQLVIDARYSHYIDKEILELIQDFQKEQAPCKQLSLNLIGFQDHYEVHDYVDFINVTTYDVQLNLTPRQVLELLKEGNQRFLDDTRIHRSLKADIKYTAKTQYPIAVVLGCIDSRVPVETIFDMSFGDLFCIRVAGNIINNDILASMEYACNVVGAKLIVVLGHTRCGAIQAACDHVKKGHISGLLAKIEPALNAEKSIQEERNSQNLLFVEQVTELNIAHSLQSIYKESPILRGMIEKEEIAMVGALYNVGTGEVSFNDYATLSESLEEQAPELLLKMKKMQQ